MKRALLLLFLACGPRAAELDEWEKRDPAGGIKLAEAARKGRVDAALALMRMERGGRHVGVDPLLDVLTGNAALVDAIAPELVRSIKEGSFAAKDTAYALLSRGLVTTETTKRDLRAALLVWIQTRTLDRLTDKGQRFSGASLVRFLGADAVRGFPELLASASAPDRPARLIAEVGDDETKERAGTALFAAIDNLGAGRDARLAEIRAINARTKIVVTPEQEKMQLEKYDELLRARAFGAMKELRLASVKQRCLALAERSDASEDTRRLALTAFPIDKGDLDRVFALVLDVRTPPRVRDAAMARVAELPRPEWDTRVLAAIAGPWQVRLSVVKLLLARAGDRELPDLLRRLGEVKGEMSVDEPLAYGPLVAKIAGDRSWEKSALESGLLLKLTALASRTDRASLERYKNDSTKLPGTWECEVSTLARLVDSRPAAMTTVGQFVGCLLSTRS